MRALKVIVFCVVVSTFSIGCRSPKPTKVGLRSHLPNYEKPLPPGKFALEKISNPAELPYFGNGFSEKTRLIESVKRSLSFFNKPSSKKHFPYLDITHSQAKESLSRFKEILETVENEKEFHETILHQFDVYRSVGYNGRGSVFFTGYCEPIYDASLTRTPEYRFPLYKLPSDLIKDEDGTPLGRRTSMGERVPYYTRKEIETRHLLEGQELVYLRDKLESYIVHIQGSARLRLRDGSEYRVGYAGKTDRPYKSIGKVLIKDGNIKKRDMSLSAIKSYFRRHPEGLDKYLHQNQSFVFFTHTQGGPYGSVGVQVTPYRSIATDKTIFPRGCLAYIETRIPHAGTGYQRVVQRPFRSFVLDQDTGGAIRSAGRADLFLGTGPEAEYLAGHTQSDGRLFYIFLKEADRFNDQNASNGRENHQQDKVATFTVSHLTE